MAIGIGTILRDLYLNSGFKMDFFSAEIGFSEKTVYYHFKQDHLSTHILEKYEVGLKKLGKDLDIWAHIARRKKGYSFEEASSGTTRVSEPVQAPERSAAELLRLAAAALEKEQAASAPERDKRPYQHD